MVLNAAFPGGNAAGLRQTGPGRIEFRADPRGGPAALWYHFRVRAPGCARLRVDQVLDDALFGGLAAGRVRPVFRRTGGRWTRVANSALDAAARRFRFTVPCAGRDTEIAFCHPYQPAQWHRFAARVLRPAGARRVVLGRTEHGRNVEAWEVGDGPCTVLLTARHHAGETPGSYTLEGIVTGLLAALPSGVALRIVPFVDLDGVVDGLYGKNRFPHDPNCDWAPTATPHWAAVRALRAWLEAMPRPPRLAIDCHAPLAVHPHFLSWTVAVGMDAAFQKRMARVAESLRAACASHPATRLSPELTGEHPGWWTATGGFAASTPGYLQTRFSTLAVIMESAYHATHEHVSVGPAAWRRLGRALATGLRAFAARDSAGG